MTAPAVVANEVIDWVKSRHAWLLRRRYLYAVTVFTMVCIGVSLSGLVPEAIAKEVVAWGFTALMTFVGCYVFGAVWDHNNIRAQITKKDSGQ